MSIAITQNLPMSLATKNLQERWERQRKLGGQPSRNDEEDMDLFSRDRMSCVIRNQMSTLYLHLYKRRLQAGSTAPHSSACRESGQRRTEGHGQSRKDQPRPEDRGHGYR